MRRKRLRVKLPRFVIHFLAFVFKVHLTHSIILLTKQLLFTSLTKVTGSPTKAFGDDGLNHCVIF